MNKIYIDTHFKTKDSISNTDFKIYLNESIEFKDEIKMFIGDISIPNSFYTIESTNENLYIETTENDVIRHFKIVLDIRNYSVVELATQIQSKLNSELNKAFTINYIASTGRLIFNVLETNFTYSVLTDDELKSITWKGKYYDRNNIKSCNDVLNNVIPQLCSSANPFVSGFVNTINYSCLYLRSNLSSLDNIGVDGNSSNIIKKIPVNASYGSLMTNYDFNIYDYTRIKNRNSISLLEFQLTDAYGNVIDLHGSHITFTILFNDD